MLSSLASYIFGTSNDDDHEVVEAALPQPTPKSEASDEDEWVMIGHPTPSLTLGCLNEIVPRPPLTGSTASSSGEESDDFMMAVEPSVEGQGVSEGTNDDNHENRQVVLTRSARRITTPFGSCLAGASLTQMKHIRASQNNKAKDSTKAFKSKPLERLNKAVRNVPKKNKAATVALKASGASRHLKQC